MLTGYLELLNLAFRKYLLDRPVLLGRHTIWMSPLADATLFVALASTFIPLVFVLTTHHSKRVMLLMLGFVLAASLVLLHGEIHNVAAAMLSGGVAVQITRSSLRRVEQFEALVRRTLPWMTATCLGTAILLPLWWNRSERWSIHDLSSIGDGAPNVLILVWDTVRAQDLSTYGYARNTSPNLTALAKDGICFEHAIAPSPWTLPSHASLFTGRWAHELSTNWGAPLDSKFPTLAEVLRAEGYATAAFIANQYVCSRQSGLDRGFLRFEDFSGLGTEFVLSCEIGRRLTTSPRLRHWIGWQDYWGRKSADRVDADFLEWLDGQPHRPFFAVLNYYDAHQPYAAVEPYYRRFGPAKAQEDRPVVAGLRHADVVGLDARSASQQMEQQQRYDASIAYLDACLGNLVEALRARGAFENTLVILTSDHGEHFGEHGLQGHGNSLYRSLLHVPLVIRLPGGAQAGLRARQVVSLRDVSATVMDLVGCQHTLPGHSLAACWKETQRSDSDAVFASVGSVETDGTLDRVDAVIVEGLHYIRYGDGREELFDFFHDSSETRDLVGAKDMQEPLSRIRALAAQSLKGPKPERRVARNPRSAR